MKLFEEFKLFETMWESAPKVVSKETSKLCSVVFDDHQIFVGTQKECEDWLKKANGPMADRLSIKNTAKVVVQESTPKVVRKQSNDLWTVTFKNDPDHPLITGDKAKVDAFYNHQKDTPAAKARGGLVIKQGGEYAGQEDLPSKKVTKSANLTEALTEKEYSVVYRLKDWSASQPDDEAFFDAETATDAIDFFMEYMLDPDNLDDDIDPAEVITEDDIIIISVAPTGA